MRHVEFNICTWRMADFEQPAICLFRILGYGLGGRGKRQVSFLPGGDFFFLAELQTYHFSVIYGFRLSDQHGVG